MAERWGTGAAASVPKLPRIEAALLLVAADAPRSLVAAVPLLYSALHVLRRPPLPQNMNQPVRINDLGENQA